MQHQHIYYQDSKIHCLRFGQGKQLLIAIHGFGDRANLFEAIATALEKTYTMISIDLPFHGQSVWTKDKFTKKDIRTIIQLILEKENKRVFTLMGYSFGGRIAQLLLFEFPDQIEKLFLIAPDGLKTKWVTNAQFVPFWFRHLTKRLLREPAWFLKLLTILRKGKLISSFIYDFAFYHTRSETGRARVFGVWFSLNEFVPNKKELKRFIQKKELPVELIFGKQDDIIPVEIGLAFIENLPTARLHIIDSNHFLINSKLNTFLKKLLAEK